MNRNRFLLLAIALVGLMASGAHATDFYLVNTLDLSNSNYFPTPLFNNASPYGTNPSAVTTNGTDIWVGGLNGGTGTSTGVVRINGAFGVSPSATSIYSQTTPGSRGYSGLGYDPLSGAVFAAYDNGAASAKGIAAYNVSDNAERWAKNVRGGSGVAYDTGFGGVDTGAGYSGFGSGRRSLQNSVTGADIYTSANGMLIGSGGNWRDIYFAPNGDFYGRGNNNVWKAVRNGGNSTSSQTMIVDLPDASGVSGQNIAYLDGLAGGDLLILNDRSSTSMGQVWSTSIKVRNPDGTPATTQFFKNDGSALDPGFAQGSGYFDFAWDGAGDYLIVSDFNNRMVYRFSTIPEPSTLLLLGIGVAGLLRRLR